MKPLPTVAQCIAFRDKINEGRVTQGREPLDVLEFDTCEPDSISNCLSARNLFVLDGQGVVDQSRYAVRGVPDPFPGSRGVIPEAIREVTDVFDSCNTEELHALRAVMLDAGVVA